MICKDYARNKESKGRNGYVAITLAIFMAAVETARAMDLGAKAEAVDKRAKTETILNILLKQ